MSVHRFGDALDRLLEIARNRIRAGELSERALARRIDVSQPHMHNVLAGKRALLPASADRLLLALSLTMDDLMHGLMDVRGASSIDGAVKMLTGPVGGGRAFPSVSTEPPVPFFDPARVLGLRAPALTRVAAEELSLRPALNPGDDILLECAPAARRRPSPRGIYVVSWKGASYVCRCRVSMGAVLATGDADSPTPPPVRMPLDGRPVEEIVRGEVIWYGRALRRL